MTAISADDGSVAWQYHAFTRLSDVEARDSGFVYLSTDDGALHALGSQSGTLVWLFQAESRGAGSIVFADAEHVVFRTPRGDVYGLQADSGRLLWRRAA